MSFNYVGKAKYYNSKRVVWYLPQLNSTVKQKRNALPEGTSLNFKKRYPR